MTTLTKKETLEALQALKDGVWDAEALVKCGPIHCDLDVMATEIKRHWLVDRCGFTVGARDPRVNTDYPGKFMVIEDYADAELPCANGGESGSWAVVGDDLDEMIDQAFDVASDGYEDVEG